MLELLCINFWNESLKKYCIATTVEVTCEKVANFVPCDGNRCLNLWWQCVCFVFYVLAFINFYWCRPTHFSLFATYLGFYSIWKTERLIWHFLLSVLLFSSTDVISVKIYEQLAIFAGPDNFIVYYLCPFHSREWKWKIHTGSRVGLYYFSMFSVYTLSPKNCTILFLQ